MYTKKYTIETRFDEKANSGRIFGVHPERNVPKTKSRREDDKQAPLLFSASGSVHGLDSGAYRRCRVGEKHRRGDFGRKAMPAIIRVFGSDMAASDGALDRPKMR